VGYIALMNNTTGSNLVAVGAGALADNTTGLQSVALGRSALRFNTDGNYNVAVGYQALEDNTSGDNNVAVGQQALNVNTASNNTAVGYQALTSNTSGTYNVAIGKSAGRAITTGSQNLCVGTDAGFNLSTGLRNTFVGCIYDGVGGSGYYVTTGSKNTILGAYNGNQGGLDIRTSSNNIVLSDGDGNVRMYMISNGDIFFSNTTESAIGGGSTDGKMIDNADGARLRSSRASTSTREHLIFYNPNGGVGSITTNGTSTSYNTSSDYRLKENVVDITGATTRLKQLSPKRFNFIADADTTVDGFLAHEVSDIIPEAISGTKDEVDADGNPVYQGIDQSKLVPLLTASLQEAIAKIEELETRITTLENA